MTRKHGCLGGCAGVGTWLCALLPAMAQEAPAEPSRKSPDSAEPDRQQCLDAHAQGQLRRNESALLEASRLFSVCGSLSCPGPIQSDCAKWSAELERQTPSVVIEARVGLQSVDHLLVFVDNQPMPALDQGRAASINPGQHVIRVEVPAYPPMEKTVTVYEGQRYQAVRFEFGNSARSPAQAGSTSAKTPALARRVERSRPIPTLTWVLGGAGALGLGGFALFGTWGQSKQHDLDQSCSPNCSKDSVDSVRQKYRFADISLAVGAAAFIGAGIVFVTRPTQEHVVSVGVAPTNGGAGLFLQWNQF